MAKIRSVEQLGGMISAETAWRKKELTIALRLVHRSTGATRVAAIRSGVLVLYAHWEGWVKNVAQFYIRYVNTQKYPYDKLSDAFLGSALKAQIDAIQAANKPSVHNRFASFIRAGLADRSSLTESLIHTESNLTSRVFFDILARLGLERREFYSMRANMIDRELVNRRNTIAHGQYLELEIGEFEALRSNTMALLESFTDDVENAAATGAHLAPPQVD